MNVFDSPDFDNHEVVSFFDNKRSGLKAIIAIHSTALEVRRTPSLTVGPRTAPLTPSAAAPAATSPRTPAPTSAR